MNAAGRAKGSVTLAFILSARSVIFGDEVERLPSKSPHSEAGDFTLKRAGSGKLRVLITNYSLASRGGTELYVRDLAFGLLKRGHTPIVYSTELGAVAKEIREATIPVVDDLAAVAVAPDVIHGHHYHETMTALLRFPRVPAIYVCHDWYSRLDAPPKFPRLLRHVAVDQTCYDKLVYETAIPEHRVSLLLNFVDLERFKPRPPLPAHPKRVLLLCNYTEENAHLAAVREACARAGLMLDIMGALVGKPCERPEMVVGNYDIVLAKGRTALEALATGAAVILYLRRAIGPMVTAGNLDRLLPLNFGIRAMTRMFDPVEFAQALTGELARYDSEDAALVSRRIRAMSGRDRAADEFLSLYEDVIAESSDGRAPDTDAEGLAAASYLRELLLGIKREREAFYKSNTFRFKERLLRLPLIGKLSFTFARRLSGSTTKRS
jgi:glycosyltransferase involved in cell wall biosynthesis